MRKFLLTTGISLLVTACAHAPQVQKIEMSVDSTKLKRSDVVTYALPKAKVFLDLKATKSTFVPGPYTVALEQWKKQQKEGIARCTADQSNEPSDPCFWRFASKRTDISNALAWCEEVDSTKPQRALLPSEAVFSTTPEPDETQIYAIDLAPGAFEKLDLGLEFSALGTLTSFSASASNLFAQSAEKILLSFASSAGGGAPTEVDKSADNKGLLKPAAVALARFQAQIEKSAARGDTSTTALAILAARQDAIRALVEGRASSVEIKERWPLTIPANSNETIAPIPLDDIFECQHDDSLALNPTLKLTPESISILKVVPDSGVDTDGGLVYRIPAVVTASLSASCIGATLKCNEEVDGKADLVLPQWGHTRSLPRRLGWGSGSLKATLDPNTGGLKTLNRTASESFAANMANKVVDQAFADKDFAALQQEQQTLDLQQKICASRAALKLPLGDGCPPTTP